MSGNSHCPYCKAEEQIPKLNPVKSFKCGSLDIGIKILQSWSCKELATLKCLVRELIHLPKILSNEDSDKFEEILSRHTVKAIMEGE